MNSRALTCNLLSLCVWCAYMHFIVGSSAGQPNSPVVVVVGDVSFHSSCFVST